LPVIGGAEIQSHNVARGLSSDYDVCVLSHRFEGMDSVATIDGVYVRRVRSMQGSSAKAVVGAGQFFAAGLMMGRPRLIQGFQLNSLTFASAVMASTWRVPLVILVTGRACVPFILGSKGGRPKLDFMIRAASAVVGVSQTVANDLRDVGVPDGKLKAIANGVDTDRFGVPSQTQRDASRAKVGFTNSDIVFCWVGRLDPEKGFRLLADTWPTFAAARAGVRLVVAGEGTESGLARKLARDCPTSVTWLGSVEDVREVYFAADANVLSSPSEGLSCVLIEASSCGLPSLVADIPENLEVGADDGFLLPYQLDPANLLLRLEAAVDKSHELRVMGLRARESVASRYALGTTVDHWRNLYDSLIRDE
jgi:glycosyltransferase involved in cell wall biosynthesis